MELDDIPILARGRIEQCTRPATDEDRLPDLAFVHDVIYREGDVSCDVEPAYASCIMHGALVHFTDDKPVLHINAMIHIPLTLTHDINPHANLCRTEGSRPFVASSGLPPGSLLCSSVAARTRPACWEDSVVGPTRSWCGATARHAAGGSPSCPTWSRLPRRGPTL